MWLIIKSPLSLVPVKATQFLRGVRSKKSAQAYIAHNDRTMVNIFVGMMVILSVKCQQIQHFCFWSSMSSCLKLWRLRNLAYVNLLATYMTAPRQQFAFPNPIDPTDL